MLTITSARINTAGDLIEICAERAETKVLPYYCMVAARINGGKWLPITAIKQQTLAGRTVAGVVNKSVAIYLDEIATAEAVYATLPATMTQLIEQRASLVEDVTCASGHLSHAMSAGNVRDYAAAALSDRTASDRAAAVLADFDAVNPAVAAEAVKRIAPVNVWTN